MKFDNFLIEFYNCFNTNGRKNYLLTLIKGLTNFYSKYIRFFSGEKNRISAYVKMLNKLKIKTFETVCLKGLIGLYKVMFN